MATSRKHPLNQNDFIQAAIKIADINGLEKLSMRKLGKEIGVEATAVYHHFQNKTELVEHMLNSVHSEIKSPNTESSWREFMTQRAHSVLEVLIKHPWAANIMESGTTPGPATLNDRELIIKCFRTSGFSIEDTVHAITILDIYIYGAAQQIVKLTFSSAEQAASVSEDVLAQFPVQTYPYLGEVLLEHMLNGKYKPLEEFNFGLELILESLTRFQKINKPPLHT